MPTTITVDPKVRDRLKKFGNSGMTYNDILTRLMDRFEEEEFTAEIRREYSKLKDEDLVDLEDA